MCVRIVCEHSWQHEVHIHLQGEQVVQCGSMRPVLHQGQACYQGTQAVGRQHHHDRQCWPYAKNASLAKPEEAGIVVPAGRHQIATDDKKNDDSHSPPSVQA